MFGGTTNDINVKIKYLLLSSELDHMARRSMKRIPLRVFITNCEEFGLDPTLFKQPMVMDNGDGNAPFCQPLWMSEAKMRNKSRGKQRNGKTGERISLNTG
ncbi:hypothetical protein ETC03_08140 [Geobacillus sp. MMMUD3]|nr:hypothetical protein [Geobacillus sp. MMMUD3]TWG30337.1 hypothetical protein GC56T2_1471 [Geobacillus sp. C56-T2]